jgi:hypothetical protein
MSNSTDTDLYLIWSSEHGAWRGPNGRMQQALGGMPRDSTIKICQNALRDDLATLFAFPELPVREADLLAVDQNAFRRHRVSLGRWNC